MCTICAPLLPVLSHARMIGIRQILPFYITTPNEIKLKSKRPFVSTISRPVPARGGAQPADPYKKKGGRADRREVRKSKKAPANVRCHRIQFGHPLSSLLPPPFQRTRSRARNIVRPCRSPPTAVSLPRPLARCSRPSLCSIRCRWL